jgi:hypothetical protein
MVESAPNCCSSARVRLPLCPYVYLSNPYLFASAWSDPQEQESPPCCQPPLSSLVSKLNFPIPLGYLSLDQGFESKVVIARGDWLWPS